MADPHIQSPMDIWDKITVIIYRLGFIIAAFSILLLTWLPSLAEITVLIAAICCASSLHIYLKHFRLTFQFATWLGLVCYILGWHELALGGALVTLGGLCFKEYFCFRVPLLNLQPIFVAILWFAWVFEGGIITRILSIIVGMLMLLLAIQKCRMPLHFDIGDKTKYQV
ncbi:hypothetical protein BKG91_05955 [Rodentibacter caecimuris]|uniref:Uncharacterized protein n=1 Tax=Rodentibacter caecimuris TaxID=1796644 RepID=A0A9X8VX30_9PAST|nr:MULTISPECIES: DUF2301 domain-containing membrane protein [Pasteurellaceae]MCQ9124658.1 hypothetical protein [Rodentibacter heylii]MCR1837469.1 DUF2301 domain-containing membrane protein [Pasteurella caecimuris]MCU0106895.1 DUF2301 domain-containing membrane protein [Pasteurella caecimuris]OOF72738.1 hypothetical protein BKG90_03360 [Rodentibacter heylii]OOF74543.1 hypothetical protein BKG91_05955 [Rodentibacter heylii]